MSGRRLVLVIFAAALLLAGIAPEFLQVGNQGIGSIQATCLVLGLGTLTALLTRRTDSRSTGDSSRETLPSVNRLGKAYVSFALVLTNTLVVLAALSLLALPFMGPAEREVRSRPSGFLNAFPIFRLLSGLISSGVDEPWHEADERLVEFFPDWTIDELNGLVSESRSRRLQYSSFVQFAEGEFQGTYVNVSPFGFRKSESQCSWPMSEEAVSVWWFGGSTLFGYGVADSQTIPSLFQAHLGRLVGSRVCSYNFGNGYYYSSQERTLLIKLLEQRNLVPDFAIFVDGINEHFEEPRYTRLLEGFMADPKALEIVDGYTSTDAETTVHRWITGATLIESLAADRSFTPIFVWQPSPLWNYSLKHHLFATEDDLDRDHAQPRAGSYALLDEMRRSEDEDLPERFLWLADIQEGRQEPLYVDRLHYSPAFSDEIARRIAEYVVSE